MERLRSCGFCGADISHKSGQARYCSVKHSNRAYRLANLEKFRSRERANYPRYKEQVRARRLGKLYGLSLVQWLALLSHQDEKCAVCRTSNPGSRGWQTDHSYVTGAVRGILCMDCNTGIGKLGDTDVSVQRAADYLKRTA